MRSVDGSRRAFLRGAHLSREGRATEIARQNPLGPPPPWHQGLPLGEHCPDCAHPCVDSCEQDIIQIHPTDHDNAGIPYLDFSLSGCSYCHSCVEACPVGIEDDEPEPELGKARLDHNTCIAWNEVICQSCRDRCDYEAITLIHQRRPTVDFDLCNGCGMCISACPMNAITVSR
jgi:ferredoxin-type protein NapF